MSQTFSLSRGFARAGGDVGENLIAATSACPLTKRMINTITKNAKIVNGDVALNHFRQSA